MRPSLLHTMFAFVLASASSLVLADPPERVGRISTAEGQVLVRAGDGEAEEALLNWPVTTDSRITTLRNALAEFRVGAAAVRLDADSELEVTELDDDSFKLHLYRGSVSVRVRNQDALQGLELTTSQARVVLTHPGWVRVDAGRMPDTSVVSVLEGSADVDGSKASVTLRAGKRAELTDEELRTGPLQRIAFDNWPETLPALASASPALRYVTEDVTGYEELDRFGAWQEDAEYGPLWLPRSVPAGWAPYSDGRWSWIAPWGWTWIDNAPWGYAPSHYGRWVLVGKRWGWTPGRERTRGAWAPALVGWVGGEHGPRPGAPHGSRPGAGPGVGWFPLSPRDRYVPGYRVSPDYERRVNRMADGRRPTAGERERREGLTMLPQERFGERRTINVPRGSRVTMPPPQVHNLPLTTAPAPNASWQRPQAPAEVRRNDAPVRTWRGDVTPRPGRLQTEDGQAAPVREPREPRRPAMPGQPPAPALPAMPAMPATPALPPVQDTVGQPGRTPSWRGEQRPRGDRPDRSDRFEHANRPERDNRPPVQQPAAAPVAAPAMPAPRPERPDRPDRPDRPERADRPERGNRPPPQQPAAAPAVAPAAPAPRPAAEARGERNNLGRERVNQGRNNGRMQEAER